MKYQKFSLKTKSKFSKIDQMFTISSELSVYIVLIPIRIKNESILNHV